MYRLYRAIQLVIHNGVRIRNAWEVAGALVQLRRRMRDLEESSVNILAGKK